MSAAYRFTMSYHLLIIGEIILDRSPNDTWLKEWSVFNMPVLAVVVASVLRCHDYIRPDTNERHYGKAYNVSKIFCHSSKRWFSCLGYSYFNDSMHKCDEPNSFIRARFLSLARSKLRLCSANHRAGYFSNLVCDWMSIVWAYSEGARDRKRAQFIIHRSSLVSPNEHTI